MKFADATTLGEALGQLSAAFRSAGLDTPGLDARRLTQWALDIDAATILREPERPLDAASLARLATAASRRLAREPVSRIVGEREFHGLAFEIAAATLDPRPETETIVDGVLDWVRTGKVPGAGAPRILDLGTGSGAILVTLLARLPEATGLGTDISDAALAVARRNADRQGVGSRALFRHSSWFDHVDGAYDLIVSNPPYIARAEIRALAPEVRSHDPVAALDGGHDGLDAYRAIITSLPARLARGGCVAFEIGAGQTQAVTELLIGLGARLPLEIADVWNDLSGIERCVAVKARP